MYQDSERFGLQFLGSEYAAFNGPQNLQMGITLLYSIQLDSWDFLKGGYLQKKLRVNICCCGETDALEVPHFQQTQI